MLQFDVASHRTKDNVAHKVRRYVRSLVASGLVPDVMPTLLWNESPWE